MLTIRQRLVALGACLAIAGLAHLPASAATIAVSNNADYALGTPPFDGDGTGCTLRKALQNAFDSAATYSDCAGGTGNDTITFSDTNVINQGTLGPFPGIRTTVVMTGPKSINGNGSDEIFHIAATTGDLTFNNFTLTNAGKSAIIIAADGKLSASASSFTNNSTSACCGGAISSNGTISLSDVTFTGNSASGAGGQGGAIYLNNSGASTITNGTFTLNSAGDSGGAIYTTLNASILPGATLTIINGLFTLNTASGASSTLGGGAIYATASGVAFVSVLDSTFTGNKADGDDGRGGAIHSAAAPDYPFLIDHTIFGLNTAAKTTGSMGGAIYNGGNMVLHTASFLGNDAGLGNGGAIASQATPPNGSATPPTPGALIGNATFQANTAANGAAIYSFASSGNREIKLINVTIDSNVAATSAGGILTENIGAGTATTRLANTIVSNNTGAGAGDNCVNVNGGSVNSIVGNLQFPGTTCSADTPMTSKDPKLDPPGVNFPDLLTFSMALKAGSAANGTGDDGFCAGFPIGNFDQRLATRPAGRLHCDIGAYESSRAPGYGSVPAPGSTITINAISGTPTMSDVVISETGDDDLTINGILLPPMAELSFAAAGTPFVIPDGGGTQTITLTCSSAVPFTTTQTLSVFHDATGSPASYTVNCIVVDPLVITTTSPLAAGVTGVPYSVPLAATGGTPPYNTWIVTAGLLPPGLLLDPNTGVISGTPTTIGSPFSFTVQVQDSAGTPLIATKPFQITVTAPLPPVITTATPLPTGITGTVYTPLTFTAASGTPPYTTWSVTAGSLPPGLTLNPGTGDLIGTPTVAGPYSFTIQVTDSTPLNGTQAFTMTVIDPPSITTATPLASGEATIPYPMVTFGATAGTPPYGNWIVTAGALPPGLVLAPATGQLTGTPTTPGPYSFTIQTTDATPLNASKAFTMTIVALPSITTASPLTAGTANTVYPGVTFAATGGTPAYTNWAVTAGSLPPGLTLTAGSGALAGTPTTPGPYSFSITVTDSVGGQGNKAFTLQVNPATPTITTATPLTAGTVNAVYAGVTFTAIGGTPPYTTWAVTAGSLPPGLTLNAGAGTLTGTPTTAGPYSFTITVTDSTPLTGSKAFTMTVNPPPPVITTPTPITAGTAGAVYPGVTFNATLGTPPYTNWAVTAGALPPGLTLNAASGALTGTPTTAGPYGFSITVTDSLPATGTKAFTVTISPAPTPTIITTSPLASGAVGTPYPGVTFAATGGTPPYVNWAVTAGTLPPGLALNAGSGALTGTPTSSAGSPYTFTIQVTDNFGTMATKAFTLAVSSCVAGVAPGGGSMKACVSGGGGTCSFLAGSAQFIPLTGAPGSPPAGTAPAGVIFPFGLFAFTLTGCTIAPVTLKLTYPSALPAGTQYYKYGPQPGIPAPSWYVLPATIAGNTATFTLVDGALGDDDVAVNGTIVDAGGPGALFGAAGGALVPTLTQWALLLLALLVLGVGIRGLERERSRRR